MTNRLAREASPYLQQHAHNPVDWYPWGPEALDRARAEDKPILLSIGYSACHWCHVMERESFEDQATARLMNDSFVSVKVDREERPDLDQVYQLVVQLMGRSGGWPLTVFLTPDQRPFFGGTYFPPVDRYGMPGFPKVLQAVAEAYRARPGEIGAQADEITRAIREVAGGAGPSSASGGGATAIRPEALARAARKLVSRFDEENGGFGQRPKFPSTMALDVLLRAGDLPRVRKALDHMRAGGIWDHLGGGFHRYSTDERWLVPHFEKMLYDNALLLRLYVDGWRAFGDERYAATAREIVAYLRREMLDAGGAFYATQDADSEGEEGTFFVWTQGQVREACGDDAELACARFGVTREGNFEGDASVLSIAKSIEELAVRFTTAPSEIERRLEVARAAMLAHREKRPKPFRDEKILASWNGLAIGALADAARALGEPAWLAMAERAFDFVWRVLVKDARVLRHAKDGAAKGPGFLDDHAYVACAAIDLYEATRNGEYLRRARALAETIRAEFMDDAGALYLVAKDGEPLIARTQDVYDHAIPSATSKALELFARLGTSVDASFAALAEKSVASLAASALENPFGLSSLVLLADRIASTSVDIVLVGESDDLLRATYRAHLPHRTIAHVTTAGESAAPLLAEGKRASAPSAFVCQHHSCAPAASGYRDLLSLLSPGGDAVANA